MKQKNYLKILSTWQILLVFFTFAHFSGVAQCTNNNVRPDDGFVMEPWNATCNGGSDGFVKITNISSSSTSEPNANRPYSVRILTGVGGGLHPSYPAPFPIGNATTFDLTGLSAGNYVIDVIDACGNTSADKPVTIGQPNPEFQLISSQIIRRITSSGGTCGDTYVIRTTYNKVTNGQTISLSFTNSSNNTFTPTLSSASFIRTANTFNYAEEFISEVPVSFFQGNPITVNLSSNLCSRPVQHLTIPSPPQNFVTAGTGAQGTIQSTINPCVSGYFINRYLQYGTSPMSVSIVETSNPGSPALDINGNPFSFTYPANHTWQNPINNLLSGLKYDTNYTITYTDACGQIVTENLFVPSPSSAIASQNSCVGFAQYSPFLDDAGALHVNFSSGLMSFPISFTITNGPTHWNTSLGDTSLSVPLSYPQVYTFNEAMTGGYQLGTNVVVGSPLCDSNTTRAKQFAPGTYTIVYTDACGRTNTFTTTIQDTAGCRINSTTSYSMRNCNYTNGNVDLTYTLSPFNNLRRSLYRINGSTETLVQTLSGHLSNPQVFTDIAPGTYKVRFGGVSGANKANYPGIGGVNGIPRLAGTNYIYEETIVVPETIALSFSSLASCSGTATGVAQGGQAPYTYALYDASLSTIIRPAQATGVFTGLTVGTTYQMQAIDECGRTFNQPLTIVNNLVAPQIGTVVQTKCDGSNSVQVTNLPSGTWTLVDSFDNAEYDGTGSSIVLTNLSPGPHTFTLINDAGCSSPASASITLRAIPTTLNFIVNDPATGCIPGSVDITAAAVTAGSESGITFSYFTDAAATLPLANPSAVSTSGTYYIKAQLGACINVRPVVVTINDCTSTIANVSCSYNGTFADSADDFMMFELTPGTTSVYSVTATFGGNSVPITLLNNDPATNVYGGSPSYFKIPNGSLGAGSFILTITRGSGAPETITVANPGTCSNECNTSSTGNKVTYYFYSPYITTDLSNATAYLPKFDQGTNRRLTAVNVDYGVAFVGSFDLENYTSGPVNFRFIETTVVTTDFAGNTYTSPTLTLTKNPAYPGFNIYPLGTTHNPIDYNYSNTNTYTSASDLANFTGVGTISNTVSSLTSFATAGGGINTPANLRGSYYYKVEYTYDCYVIDAIDDAYGPIPVANTSTNVGIVFSNDTLNGVAVIPSEVTLTSTATPHLSINPTTGAVTVAANTPAGTYTIDYTICEVANPANCDTATVTVNVVIVPAPSINITKDGAYVDNDNNGVTNVGDTIVYTFVVSNTGNVPLTNVTITDNNAVVSGGPLAVLPVGGVDSTTFTAVHTITQSDIEAGYVYNLAIATGTPPSGPNVTDESSDPTPCTTCPPNPQCPDCTITPVPENVIDAVADVAPAPVNGLIGGDAGINIFDNDTLNGQPLNPADVTMTSVPTPELTINPDGSVTVAPGTPAGTYTIDYTICEIVNPTNCDTTTVTVVVECVFDLVESVQSDLCIRDEATDLFTLLDPSTIQGGTWQDTDNSGALQGNVFNPASAALGTYTFTYTVMNGACPSTSEVTINVNDECIVLCTIVVYNAMTPDGDGLNDIFTIAGIECHPDNNVMIFNRWGVKVFETDNYDNNSKVFNGYSNGRNTVSADSKLPTGTYYYILKYRDSFNGNTVEKAGYLYINGK